MVCALVLALAWCGYELSKSITSAYSQEWVSLAIADYVSRHDSWPRCWEELKESYARVSDKHGPAAYDFETAKQYVEISFRHDLHFLKAHPDVAKSHTFVKSSQGTSYHLANPDPNERIRNVIKQLSNVESR